MCLIRETTLYHGRRSSKQDAETYLRCYDMACCRSTSCLKRAPKRRIVWKKRLLRRTSGTGQIPIVVSQATMLDIPKYYTDIPDCHNSPLTR